MASSRRSLRSNALAPDQVILEDRELDNKDPSDNESEVSGDPPRIPAGPRRSSDPGSVPAITNDRVDSLLDALTKFVTRDPSVQISEQLPSKGPDARAPDKFDGTSPIKLRPFLSQCRMVFLNHPHRFRNDRQKVLYAGSYLSGVAADWFEPFITDDSGKNNQTLDDWQLFLKSSEIPIPFPQPSISSKRFGWHRKNKSPHTSPNSELIPPSLDGMTLHFASSSDAVLPIVF